MGTCAATNKDGTPCNNDAMEDSEFCHVHRPSDESETAVGPADEPSFGAMLAGALAVTFLAYFLLRVLLNI